MDAILRGTFACALDRFRRRSALVLLPAVLRLQRDERGHTRRQPVPVAAAVVWGAEGGLMCAHVCDGSAHLLADGSWGMPCRSGFMVSLVEKRLSALACVLEHRVASLSTM